MLRSLLEIFQCSLVLVQSSLIHSDISHPISSFHLSHHTLPPTLPTYQSDFKHQLSVTMSLTTRDHAHANSFPSVIMSSGGVTRSGSTSQSAGTASNPANTPGIGLTWSTITPSNGESTHKLDIHFPAGTDPSVIAQKTTEYARGLESSGGTVTAISFKEQNEPQQHKYQRLTWDSQQGTSGSNRG